jgi:lysophospholipase L1-like esterase
VVGDSVTFGWGVEQEKTYPRQLENELNRLHPLGADLSYEVLNFGVGNYAAGDVAAMLEHKALSYAPDLVLYGAFVNDAELPHEDEGLSLLRHSLFAVWLWGKLDNLGRQWGWREDFRDYYLGLYREGGAGQTRVQQSIMKMQELCTESNTPFVIAMLPELHDQTNDFFLPIRKIYSDVAKDVGATFFDLNSAIASTGRKKYWVSDDDAHPNAEAFQLYARKLGQELPWRSLLESEILNSH